MASATVAHDPRSWVPLVGTACTPALYGAAFVAGELSVGSSALAGGLYLVAMALQLLSPLWLGEDRRYVARTSDWRPSVAYFSTCFLLLGGFVALLYLYRRHRYLGMP